MLKIEWKKLWVYQRGGGILLIALLAYIALCLFSGTDSTKAIRQNEAVYLSYIQRWQGELTDQKATELQDEYYRLNHTSDPEMSEAKEAFKVVYDQYYYAKENSSRRYLMDERGWNTLLTHDNINFILVLCLLALCVPVFCGEYSCQMDHILRSCRNGREQLAKDKLLVMVLASTIVAFLFQAVQIVVVMVSVGLGGFSYPLQSLAYFENSPYLLTVGQAYGVVVLCRIIGAAWFSILIALLSVLCKRTVLTVFAGISAAVLPHLLGGSFLKYVLPLPAGMMAGTGYLWGTLTEPRFNADYTDIGDVVVFRGVSPAEFCVLLCLFIIVWGVTAILTVRRYVGPKRNAGVRNRRLAALAMALSVVLLMSGCSRRGEMESVYAFFGTNASGETTAYTIELDQVDGTIYATDRQSGERFLLNRNSFAPQGDIFAIHVTEDTCYYAVEVLNNAGEGVFVYGIDLHNFSEWLAYANFPDNTADFWGLYQ